MINPCWTFSLTKWQSISTCLVISWNIVFSAMAIADLLSQNKVVGHLGCIPRSKRRYHSHWISHAPAARLLYSASEEDLYIVCCFLDFQETKALPKKMQKHVTDLLVYDHAAQSAFVKAWSCWLEFATNQIPFPGALFKYRRTLWASTMCLLVEASMIWLSCCTAKDMSSLVAVRYKSLPTSFLYIPTSVSGFPSPWTNFWPAAIGVIAGLQSRKPTSLRISIVYFLWQMFHPSLVLQASIPKKYLMFPRSLILNVLSKNCFKFWIASDELLLVTIKSSTSTKMAVKDLSLVLVKSEGSDCSWM